jgi:YVTN family beta-propeller protein
MKTLIVSMILFISSAGVSLAAPFVYVADSDDNKVLVVDAATNTIVDTIPVGNEPIGTAVSSNGRFVYIVNLDDETLSVINALNNTVIDTVQVGGDAFGVAANRTDSSSMSRMKPTIL